MFLGLGHNVGKRWQVRIRDGGEFLCASVAVFCDIVINGGPKRALLVIHICESCGHTTSTQGLGSFIYCLRLPLMRKAPQVCGMQLGGHRRPRKENVSYFYAYLYFIASDSQAHEKNIPPPFLRTAGRSACKPNARKCSNKVSSLLLHAPCTSFSPFKLILRFFFKQSQLCIHFYNESLHHHLASVPSSQPLPNSPDTPSASGRLVGEHSSAVEPAEPVCYTPRTTGVSTPPQH